MDSLVKVAVIGTGHLGNIHTKLWQSCPNAELTGIYDSDSKRAEVIASEYDCENFDSLEKCIASCDAVTIAAPTTNHYEIALKCIENNVHCFIEKPITETYEQAKKLIATAKEKNILMQVGHVERFNPALAALKDYKLNPMFIEAHRLSQFKPRAIDVSVVHDLMIHDIDIMLSLIDSEIEKIDANGVAVLTETHDIANARITFKNGAVANLTASRISARPMRKMRLFQENAYISIDFGNSDVEIYRILDESETAANPATMLGTIDAGINNKKISFEKPPVPQVNAIAEEQKSFVDAILNKKPTAVSGEAAAEALRIAEEISVKISQ